ncbi:MAG: hypothetical protein KBD50_01080 [Candidatus Pacebacteria bacterium]|nr:hypothetical protein [Candidatus Paceibacterota bacterium]
MVRKVIRFFDKLEDRVRARLSRNPILYALIGGVGIVLFWKGTWETAEAYSWLHGPASIVAGVVIMLSTGLLVSFFIGDSIILSGFKKEKKLVEKTEQEILKAEKTTTDQILAKLDHLEQDIHELKKEEPQAAETSNKLL